jgi:hypothetical protein
VSKTDTLCTVEFVVISDGWPSTFTSKDKYFLQSDYHSHGRSNFRLSKEFELRLSCSESPAPGPHIDQFLSSSPHLVTLPNTPLLISTPVMYVTLVAHDALSIWFDNIMLKNLQFTIYNLQFIDKNCLAINNLLLERKYIFGHRLCC